MGAELTNARESPAFPLTHLMVWCPHGGDPRGIRVRHVTLRKLTAAESLAPAAEIMAKASALPIPDFGTWETALAKQKPADVSDSDWRRACGLKTLAAGGSIWAVRPMVDLLAGDAIAMPGSVEEQVQRLDELALLNDVGNHGGLAGNFMHHYEQIGERMQRRESPSLVDVGAGRGPQPAVVHGTVRRRSRSSGPPGTARSGLRRKAGGGHAAFAADAALESPRAAASLGQRLGLQQNGETGLAADRKEPAIDHRHPFIEELNKEGFNLLGDFQAAMSSKAYHDACQIVTATDSTESLGLWPNPQDPQLLVSVNGAIDLALSHDEQLRQTMIREFGPVGMLQVRQAMNEGDAATVAAATSRYRGTDAAAQAALWLADRAISTGEFAHARAYYARARKTASAAILESIAPRDRLAAAMMGDDAGQPCTAPVRLGDVQLSAAEFESLVAEMRKAHATVSEAGADAAVAAAPVAPLPHSFETHEIGRLDGEVGDNPGDSAPWPRAGAEHAILHQTSGSAAVRRQRPGRVSDHARY